jgi:myo-inositol-1(or 4)-monophosphatase
MKASPTTPTLLELETIAREAGAILKAGFGKVHQVHYKSEIDLVTEMDHRAETHILGRIRGRFPGHRIVAEESGVTMGEDGHSWYIDPLDGTINYAHNIPIFAVSIAYAEMGEVQLGVVYAPLLDECFSAEKGTGVWLNGNPLQASQTQDLIKGLLVTGFANDQRENPINLEYFRRFALQARGLRRLGSAALDLCYVAAGRFDGYWEPFINPWDIAAGMLIAAESGAVTTRVYGEPVSLQPPCSILAAPPAMHRLMLDVLLRE